MCIFNETHISVQPFITVQYVDNILKQVCFLSLGAVLVDPWSYSACYVHSLWFSRGLWLRFISIRFLPHCFVLTFLLQHVHKTSSSQEGGVQWKTVQWQGWQKRHRKRQHKAQKISHINWTISKNYLKNFYPIESYFDQWLP